MPSAGDLLRSERVKRNRSLSEIANATCIATRYLEAIEQDDTKVLPGDFFHRSFIRQYAVALELDATTTKRILEAVGPVVDVDPFPRLSVPQRIAEVEQSSKPLSRIPVGTAATLLVIVLAGCSGLYAIWRRGQEKAELQVAEAVAAQPDERSRQAAEKAPVPDSKPSSENSPVNVSQSPANRNPETPGSPTPESSGAATPVEAGKISVDLSATEKTWVSLSSAGQTVFSGILDASQTKNFAVSENAKLLTGNAAGLDVRMNGRPLGPLGSRGQVRIVLFSQNDVQILSRSRL